MKSENLLANYHMFSGVLNQCDKSFNELEKEVANKKLIVKYKDDIINFLESLQAKEHEKIVGKFEKWLTALLQDVFQTKDTIKLTLHTDYHKTGLDISVDRNGFTEDIYQGNGGALTNLIATGLRLISVAVTHRHFLVLDEPDCWMREDLLPRFFKTISQYSRELGIQVIIITHHAIKNWADKEFYLEHDGSKTYIKDEEDIYQGNMVVSNVIKSIELNNWMKYEKEIFNLSAGVNLITGENNICKSGFLQALRCIFYNENPQTFIRHGEKEAEVRVNFIKNYIIFKANHKATNYVRWELYDNTNQLIKATEGSRNFPEWLSQFNIGEIENIDLQLARQKEPASILSASPHTRATLLSLNKESSYAQKMLDYFKKEYRQANDFVKNGENELTSLKNKLQYRNVVQNLGLQCEKLKFLEEQSDETEKLLHSEESKLSIWQHGLNLNYELPSWEDIKFFDFSNDEKKLVLWNIALNNLQFGNQVDKINWETPEIKDYKNEEYKINLWNRLNHYLKFVDPIENLVLPEPPNLDLVTNGEKLLSQHIEYIKNENSLLELLEIANKELSLNETAMQEIEESHVGICPNCGNSIREKDLFSCH